MNRYEKSWRYLFNGLPGWKQAAITEDQQNQRDSSVLNTFVKDVIALAEGELTIPEPFQEKKTKKLQKKA